MKDRFYEALNEIEQDDDKYMVLYRNGEVIANIDGGEGMCLSFYAVDSAYGCYLGIGAREKMHLYFDDLKVKSI